MFSEKSGKENSNIFIVNTAFCPNCVNAVLRHRIMLLPRSLPGGPSVRSANPMVMCCVCYLYLCVFTYSLHMLCTLTYLKAFRTRYKLAVSLSKSSRWPLPSNNRLTRSSIPHQYGNKKLDKVPPYTEPSVAYYVYYVRDFPSLTITRHTLRYCTIPHLLPI